MNGLTGDSQFDPFHRPAGTRVSYQMIGVLEGGAGTATRVDRDCDIRFAKQSVGAGKIPAADANAQRTAALAVAPSDVRRFDGNWVVNAVCESKPLGLPKVTARFVAKANNGVLHGERGQKDKPGWQSYDGTIEPDGSITINVNGLTGDSQLDPFHRPTGTRISYQMIGVLEGGAGTATRVDRDCDIRFAKQSVGGG
jgi:hypothetical protein